MAVVDGAGRMLEVNEALATTSASRPAALVGQPAARPRRAGRRRPAADRHHRAPAAARPRPRPVGRRVGRRRCRRPARRRARLPRRRDQPAQHRADAAARGAARQPDQPAQPAAAARPPGDRADPRAAHAGRGWRCCSSTSTSSRRSTTPSATTPATRCWSRCPPASSARCGPATRWPGSAATSSSWCARTSTDDDDLAPLVDRLLEGIRPAGATSRPRRCGVGRASAWPSPDRGGETGEELLRLADLAMYRAKRHPELDVVADETLATSSPTTRRRRRAGRRAAARDPGRPAAAALPAGGRGSTARLIGLEALRALAAPAARDAAAAGLPAARRGHRLARSLTDWVLRAAIRDAASWHDPSLRVSVNVWARRSPGPGSPTRSPTLLTWAGLQARGLYLEMHEQDLPEAGPGLPDELDRLRRLGVGLAIDDFGSGGTSLAGLRRLPVDTLKVDRAVRRRLRRRPGGRRGRRGGGDGGQGGRPAPAGVRRRDGGAVPRPQRPRLRVRPGLPHRRPRAR